MALLLTLGGFISECRRVLRLTKKPTNEELVTIVKVAGIGILLIGFIGFIMQTLRIMIK